MKAIVVSAFPGSGKTYAFEHQKELGFRIKDSDSSKYEKDFNWAKHYADDIEKAIESNEYDFIFVSQHQSIRMELNDRGISFCTVSPPGFDSVPYSKFLSEKTTWMKRFENRDNSHIKNILKFINDLNNNYNSWTTKDAQNAFGCKLHVMLYNSRNLSDSLKGIREFWEKNKWFEE